MSVSTGLVSWETIRSGYLLWPDLETRQGRWFPVLRENTAKKMSVRFQVDKPYAET